MRVFQAVVEEGGFAAAARSMDFSPPVVTRLVADLEQHLGTRLLQRTTRKLALTDAGEAYLQRVRAILHEIEDAEAAAAASTRDLHGTIRVLAAPVLATHFLAPLLAPWHACYPRLMLDILVDAFPSSRVDEFDVTFMVAGGDYDGNIVARPMLHGEAIVIAAPRYLQCKGMPAEPGDLHNHEYLRDSGQVVRTQSGFARRVRLLPAQAAAGAGGGNAGGVAVRQHGRVVARRRGRHGRDRDVAAAGRTLSGHGCTGACVARLDCFALHGVCRAAIAPHDSGAHQGVA